MIRTALRIATLFAAVIVTALVTGCARGAPEREILTLPRWTLDVEGPSPAIEVTLPAHLDRHLPRERARYTLRSAVPLPPSLVGEELVLTVPSLPAIAELRVEGIPEPIREDGAGKLVYRAPGPHAWRVPRVATRSGVVDLTIVVEHEWTQSGWIDGAPRLTAASPGDTTFELQRSMTETGAMVALGTLLPIGFCYLVLFLLDRRRAGSGWFFVHAIAGSFYALFVLGSSQRLFGRADAVLLALSQVVAPIAGLRFTYERFGLGRPSRIFDLVLVIGAGAAIVFSGPFDVTPLASITVLGLLSTLGYHIWLLARLVRSTPESHNAAILLVGWSIIALSIVIEGPVWLGYDIGLGAARIGCWGIPAIAICQAIVLMRDYAASLRRSDALVGELAGRVCELETRARENAILESELRRQVVERGRAFSTSLARLSLAPEAPAALGIGTVVDARFRVERQIGAGGMGTVYEVTRLVDGVRFALKIMRGATDALKMARFAREAQLGAHVVHPNVVGIVDVQISTAGFLYLVMDFVPGRSLHALAERRGDVRWALGVLAQTGEGLAAIHAQDVVHRDLKPSNVLVDERTGAVRITDFGISREASCEIEGRIPAHEDDALTVENLGATAPPPRRANLRLLDGASDRANDVDPDLTDAGAAIGTPLWSAPESAGGSAQVGRSADVYGLGLLAVVLLTGAHPRKNVGAIALLRRTVSRRLAAAIEAALDTDKHARPTAAALARALHGERLSLAIHHHAEKAS